MKITVIGLEPPCPRCERMYVLSRESIDEIGIEIELNKISFDSEAAKQYGKVGTAHEIAEWSGMEVEWSKIGEIIADGWSKELDDFLMPCKVTADENGWLMTPVLVIDDEVVCTGYVPDKEFIKSKIKKNLDLGGMKSED